MITTTLDPAVTPEFIGRVGATAVKLLVIWRPDEGLEERTRLVLSFLDVARAAGVPSLVEAIVRPATGGEWDGPDARHEAILQAAREVSTLGGTIYKAEMPGYLPGDVSRVREHAERMSDIVPVPWVVLSNGVNQPDFAPGVREACSAAPRASSPDAPSGGTPSPTPTRSARCPGGRWTGCAR